ncbi:tyrosine-type recombinase/integrase [Vreelandella alkaliphila]|uniref:Tyrosine-type recombinase/integrase n=1 Tax=Vreelandella alkaliphila TaxID=272774 RepID=A0A7C9NR80_9GAMM|nr:tyrosine-type recombinase/integrase [Halomonas alkaliphila]NDL70492.1 tyrosine-type recombinase/integrase [Halomonas alkaliphila]
MWGTVRRWKQRRSTVNQFAVEYQTLLASQHLTSKTIANRSNCLRLLCEGIGTMRMSEVRPAHIAQLINTIWAGGRQFTARRVLYEAEAFFDQALLADLVDRNPASPVKAPPAKVARSRLTLELYQEIYTWASQHSQPWFAYALRLALATAQRRSDLVRMHKANIVDGHLHVEQFKTGARIALPLALQLNELAAPLREIIRESDDYRRPGSYLIRKKGDLPLGPESLSSNFTHARKAVTAGHNWGNKAPPTFHEIRSLSERLYRTQGINTRILLGHKRQSMTDEYNDDRGLTKDNYQRLTL